ncbi:MAG: tetratricopeptide repeat protein [Polyangia bacterium]
MARRVEMFLLVTTIVLVGANTLGWPRSAFGQEMEMDEKGEATAKEAMLLFKQGQYEDAAKIFAKLSIDYPDILVFERNLGACFYHLKKAEPALSNLSHYLSHKRDIAQDDKDVVDRWISEMEKLRDQEAAAKLAPTAPPVSPASETASAAVQPEAASESRPELTAPTSPAYLPAPVAQPAAPAALNLSTPGKPAEVQEQKTPFYKTWWFWTGAAAVVAGTATAILLGTRSGAGGCDGASLACMGVK